jgi:two-component system CheB/CheR fusion protein
MLALRALAERFVPASVLINRKYEILYFAGPTQDYLQQPTGVPTQDLMSRVRGGLEARLRGAIRKAVSDGETVVAVGAASGGPALASSAAHGGATASIAGARRAAARLVRRRAAARAGRPPCRPPREHEEENVRQLEDGSRRCARTCGTVDELQANQELRVANEEVMSVNEELRSSNEELETSKEELQSLNEELTTVNAELKEKVLDLEHANNDVDNLLISSNIATIFLDLTFHLRRFTPGATRLFNLIPGCRPADQRYHRRYHRPVPAADAKAVLVSCSRSARRSGSRRSVDRTPGLAYRTRDDRIEAW